MDTPRRIITPGPILGECQLMDLEGGERLAMRHRGNPNGAWVEIAATTDRPGDNYHVIALLADGTWTRVLYHQASGRKAGIVETTPRKKKGSKKSAA